MSAVLVEMLVTLGDGCPGLFGRGRGRRRPGSTCEAAGPGGERGAQLQPAAAAGAGAPHGGGWEGIAGILPRNIAISRAAASLVSGAGAAAAGHLPPGPGAVPLAPPQPLGESRFAAAQLAGRGHKGSPSFSPLTFCARLAGSLGGRAPLVLKPLHTETCEEKARFGGMRDGRTRRVQNEMQDNQIHGSFV